MLRMGFLFGKDAKIILRHFRILSHHSDMLALHNSFSASVCNLANITYCRNHLKVNTFLERSSDALHERTTQALEKNAGHCFPVASCSSRRRMSSFPLRAVKRTYLSANTTGQFKFGRIGYTAVYHRSVRRYRGTADGDGQQQPVINPIELLQKHVAVSLIPPDQMIFTPTPEELMLGQSLFLPGHKHKIQFLKSAVFKDHLPQYELPEVGFIGHSNVGKSSLISMLFNGVEDLDVRVSKTPGHTKTLNFFQVGQKLSVVDMPGYGYRMPSHYRDSVEHFIATRPNLCRIFFLVDGTVGVTPRDVIGLNMMEEFRTPYAMTFLLMDGKRGPTALDVQVFNNLQAMNVNLAIVMTKIDKARPAQVIRSLMSVLKYRDQTSGCFQQPFLVSSVTGDGVALLQTFIAYVTGNVAIEGL